jgi:hypothetical protein
MLRHLVQDVKIERGREFTSGYTFMMDLNEYNTVRTCDVLVYRWEQPSRFVEFPGEDFLRCSKARARTNLRRSVSGMDQLYPGFEILCTVEADVRAAYDAAPIQMGRGGKRYKQVHVRQRFRSSRMRLTPSPPRFSCAWLSEQSSLLHASAGRRRYLFLGRTADMCSPSM